MIVQAGNIHFGDSYRVNKSSEGTYRRSGDQKKRFLLSSLYWKYGSAVMTDATMAMNVTSRQTTATAR